MKYLLSTLLMIFACIGLCVSVLMGALISVKLGAAAGWVVGAAIFAYACFLYSELLDDFR